MKWYSTLLCAGLISVIITSAALAQWWTAPPSDSDLIYIPKNLSKTAKYPLLIVLSPSGDPRAHIQLLAPLAQKHHWIIAGDSFFKNGIPMNTLIPHIYQTIQKVQSNYPIDPNKIYACGLSGGAMGSYDLAEVHPELIKGIIANTGMMPYANDPPDNTPLPSDFPRNKLIVMLASPTDFRYNTMKKNRTTLESLGWKIKWIEFQGGHTLAPAQCYDDAITWLSQQP